MRSILEFPLARFRFGLWRLGQAGLILRVRGGPVIAVDPYLTDAAGDLVPLMHRRFPPPVPPADLDADLVLISHTHNDHLDPGTLLPSRAFGRARFAGPPSVCTELGRLGVPAGRLTPLGAGDVRELAGARIEGVKAWHSPDVPDAIGFRLALDGGGLAVFLTGDTRYHETLRSGGPPDLLVLPINGKLGNMGVEEAVRLIGELKPRVAVPDHYDLIAANGEDPAAFTLHLELNGLAGRGCVLPAMTPLLLGEDGTPTRAEGALGLEWNCGHALKPVAPAAPYRLRGFRDADVPLLGRVYQRTFGAAHDEYWLRRELLADPLFDPGRVFVVDLHGEPVAAAVAWEEDGRRALHHGVIRWVATDPAHHQRGLGKAVVEAAMGYFQRDGRRAVGVTVEDWRVRSILAYRSLGFEPVRNAPELERRWDNVLAAADRESLPD